MTRRQRRFGLIALIGCALSAAVALSLFALRDGISFALSPAELKAARLEPGSRVRLFGLVEEGSVVRGNGLDVAFDVRLEGEAVTVRYDNILPDLFREGQGIIAEGKLGVGGNLIADTVLAKHDENYVPKEIADSLKEKGLWRDAASANQ